MKIVDTDLKDVKIIEPNVFYDSRGFFMETFRDSEFKDTVADVCFVQDNHSKSSRGILRGLHYQLENTQGKLVRVISGEVFDVAVDIRKDSPDFGKWTGVLLSGENKKMFWVPAGFAHGFYVISNEAEFVYKCTDYYAPSHERAILWNDPDIGIEWPLVNGSLPILSEKDEKAGFMKNAEVL